MIAGIILSNSLEEDSKVAFLGDELTVFSVETNEDIVDLFEEFKPEVAAFDVGTVQSGKEFTKAEQNLKDEGYIFTPNSFQRDKVERLQSLEKFTKHKLNYLPDFVRFEPQISAKELMITGEDDLASFGVEGDISGDKEFDAVLGAVTARFYDQGDAEEIGVVVPGKSKNT